ncbi:uncharacterized protein LOC141875988 isoform X2 [Acropora palmata]|uniref:uncharacterized protein LOC141875988 isoform X2 n=1 Tax=Acropora palmata TaxID=6131 RepID=UPI003DA19C12
MELLNVDGDGNAKLSDSKCGQLLHHLKAFPIEFLEDISVLVYPHLYKLQSEIIHDYDGLSRVPEGYLIYLPPEAAGLEPFQSSALGNCLWCSLSIVLEGDEHCQNQLRLGAVVATLCNMKAFTKDISVDLCSSDEALAWAGTVAARDEILTPLLGLQSPSDIVKGVISEEIKETLKNFSYSDPTEAQRLKPVNILWVPATLGHDTYDHIVPLLPWKCGCVSSELCLFGRGLNQEDKWRTQRKEMVQCSSCREWYHCVCLGYSLRQVARSNLDCGCRLLPQNSRRVLSKERSVYSDDKKMKSLVLSKTKMKNLARNLFHARMLSIRNAIFRNPAGRHSLQGSDLRQHGLGPVACEEAIEALFGFASHVLDECGIKFATTSTKMGFIADVFVPEAVLQVIMKNEGLNYFRANLFLKKYRL